ncbi:hypothetical protein A4G99_11605 [Haladaptatus sp. R4]|nr:DUF2332 domain-containing protein [Haladaptatus sp. R4]KZN23544.1 hypothetical protein A4G99_11605 [Haladaptatus sp. R4]
MSLAEEFEWFADWCVGTSPLYEKLARGVADDPYLLSLAEEIPPKRGTPNILFAAVHWHLLSGVSHPLTDFYPSVTDDPKTADPFPPFREFCAEHEDELLPLLRNRRTQTNAVRRCTALFPAFSHISNEVGGEPLALVELGPSGGLNLCWDRYVYDYGDEGRYGTGECILDSEIRSERSPPLPDEFPRVASRIGIDLNPLDVRDETDARWLRALVWPEHEDRHRLLRGATNVARRNRSNFDRGTRSRNSPTFSRGFRRTFRSACSTRRCDINSRKRHRTDSGRGSKLPRRNDRSTGCPVTRRRKSGKELSRSIGSTARSTDGYSPTNNTENGFGGFDNSVQLDCFLVL